MSQIKNIAPAQKSGVKTGALACKKCSSKSESKKLFEDASKRLLSINEWAKFSGANGSEFTLTDFKEEPILNKIPEVGNLIKIKLPAPKNKTGNGYDWVRIENIDYGNNVDKHYNATSIRVRPVTQISDNGKIQTTHFYTDDATSTFCVIRRKKTIWAIELGRNEKPNIEVSFINALRNFVIAMGARFGLAKIQWKLLMNGILNYKS